MTYGQKRRRYEIEEIRRSQYIYTSGPGAIIESRNGPFLVPALNNGIRIFNDPQRLREYRISNSRIRAAIRVLTNLNAEVVALPTDKKRFDTQYGTYRFPRWRICFGRRTGNHGTPIIYSNYPYRLTSLAYDTEESKNCPICHLAEGTTAIRFVTACIRGHLDEVPWDWAIHRADNIPQNQKCYQNYPNYYIWRSEGVAFSNIFIECPKCHCRRTMQDLNIMHFNCRGRLPEKDNQLRAYTEQCHEEAFMKIIQRQSTSLRIPNIITLLTIPRYDCAIFNVLNDFNVFNQINLILRMMGENTDIHIFIENVKNLQGVEPEQIQTIIRFATAEGVNELLGIVNKLNNPPDNIEAFMYEEFEDLCRGQNTSELQNFVIGEKIVVPAHQNNLYPELIVLPIPYLKTITAQVGYYRLPYINEDLINNQFIGIRESPTSNTYWYPGFEGSGEGLFITFANPSKFLTFLRKAPAYEEWSQRISTGTYQTIVSKWGNIVQDPLFAWWHTFSHYLIKTIFLHSGYSSASLRERVYLNENHDSGGLLIYTTSSNSDGSMGGLVGLVDPNTKEIEGLIQRTADLLGFCSNDPLCQEVRKSIERTNGAACHSCLLISETSCEHRNFWLDRHIFLRD